MPDKTHGVAGTPDPNFKPDPNLKKVWDDVKKVWRMVPIKQKDDSNGAR
jgi:hypothetical protein